VLLALLLIVSVFAIYGWLRPPEKVEVKVPTGIERSYYIPILDKWLTESEIVNEIRKEGKVVIADWTYGGLVETYHVPAFKNFIKKRFGVDIEVTWVEYACIYTINCSCNRCLCPQKTA
jgi:hypothetical protein